MLLFRYCLDVVVLILTVFVLNIMIIRLYILLVSYFFFTWLSGYFGRKVINKLDLNYQKSSACLASMSVPCVRVFGRAGRALVTRKRAETEPVSASRLAGMLQGLRTRQGDGVKLDTLRFGKWRRPHAAAASTPSTHLLPARQPATMLCNFALLSPKANRIEMLYV